MTSLASTHLNALKIVSGLLLLGVCVFVAGWVAHREYELYLRATRTPRRRPSTSWPPW